MSRCVSVVPASFEVEMSLGAEQPTETRASAAMSESFMSDLDPHDAGVGRRGARRDVEAARDARAQAAKRFFVVATGRRAARQVRTEGADAVFTRLEEDRELHVADPEQPACQRK